MAGYAYDPLPHPNDEWRMVCDRAGISSRAARVTGATGCRWLSPSPKQASCGKAWRPGAGVRSNSQPATTPGQNALPATNTQGGTRRQIQSDQTPPPRDPDPQPPQYEGKRGYPAPLAGGSARRRQTSKIPPRECRQQTNRDGAYLRQPPCGRHASPPGAGLRRSTAEKACEERTRSGKPERTPSPRAE